MNRNEVEQPYSCYLHPKEVIVGVCSLCLKEKLLVLASKQRLYPRPRTTNSNRSFAVLRKNATVILPRFFALGSFLRLEPQHQRPNKDDDSDEDSITSLEDSFISIKFEDNGHASWDSKKSVEPAKPTCNKEYSVVEHAKQRGASMRWRKKIGQLLQVARWKRSSKAGATCHMGLAGKVEGVKGGRRGWIRSLTQRRTTSTT